MAKQTISDDVFYDRARAFTMLRDEVSTTSLQTELRIGFTRASRIMKQLERDKIVSPARESKPRQVLHRIPESITSAPSNGEVALCDPPHGYSERRWRNLAQRAEAAVIEHQRASVAFVQKELKIGQRGAELLLGHLQAKGVVSPKPVNKFEPRIVLVGDVKVATAKDGRRGNSMPRHERIKGRQRKLAVLATVLGPGEMATTIEQAIDDLEDFRRHLLSLEDGRSRQE